MSKLYQHYKGPYYRKIAEARHSETGEDVVFYEPLYDTPSKYWVRPKEMFHGAADGKTGPVDRFRQIHADIHNYESIDENLTDVLWPLVREVFTDMDRIKLVKTFENYKNYLIQIAKVGNRAVGFKVGYETRPHVFYSYLGGVTKEFQRLGVATSLMVEQHDWAKSKGYDYIRVKTVNNNVPMLQLSLKFGFNIYGTELMKNRLMILMEKSLHSG